MLWVCHIWLLLCWGMFLLCLLSGEFYCKWMLNFVKGFLCIYWDNHIVFIFQFVNIVHHIDWLTSIEESLYPWDKVHLLMWMIFLICFWILFARTCWGFLHLCSSVILACSFLFVCATFVWFWYEGDGGFIEWVWYFAFLCHFLEE